MDQAETIILKSLLIESPATAYQIAKVSERYSYISSKTHKPMKGLPQSTANRKIESLKLKGLIIYEQKAKGRRDKICDLTAKGLFSLAIEGKLSSEELYHLMDRLFSLLDLSELTSLKEYLSGYLQNAVEIARSRINLEYFNEEWAILMLNLAMVETSMRDINLHDQKNMKNKLKRTYEKLAESNSEIISYAHALPYLLSLKTYRSTWVRHLKRIRSQAKEGLKAMNKEVTKLDVMIKVLGDERKVREILKKIKGL